MSDYHIDALDGLPYRYFDLALLVLFVAAGLALEHYARRRRR